MASPIGLLGGFIVILATIQNIEGLLPPLARFMQQNLNSIAPNQIPDPASVLELNQKSIILNDDYMKTMQKHGFNRYWSVMLKAMYQRYPLPADYITLLRRGKIPYDEFKLKLKFYGYDDKSIESLLQASKLYPPINDLIRFGVREVYNADIRRKFEMDQDFPKEFGVETEKLGMDREHAQNYWAAHWDLPSPNMGFEMLHRRIIQKDELKMLLKALDVMPFWREKLIQLSYNPLTRVDVRRMHKIGVLSNEETYNAYRDIGYNEKNAKRMLDFTVKYNASEVDSVTLSQIKNAYIDGIISQKEMVKWFGEIGLSKQETSFHLHQAIFDRTLKQVKLKKQAYINRYRIGDLTIQEVEQELYKEGLPANYVKQVTEELIIDKAARIKSPSKEDAIEWLNNQVIDDVEFNNIMKRLGYSDKDILRYLTNNSITNDSSRKVFLEKSVYIRWYKHKIMSYQEFVKVFREMKVSEKDINLLLAELQGGGDES